MCPHCATCDEPMWYGTSRRGIITLLRHWYGFVPVRDVPGPSDPQELGATWISGHPSDVPEPWRYGPLKINGSDKGPFWHHMVGRAIYEKRGRVKGTPPFQKHCSCCGEDLVAKNGIIITIMPDP